MSWKKIIKKERKIWHEYFVPSLIAGSVADVEKFCDATKVPVEIFTKA
jgi:hypothetical protein